MIKATGCCLFRLILLGLMLAIVVGIIMYVAPIVQHDLEKTAHNRNVSERHGETQSRNK